VPRGTLEIGIYQAPAPVNSSHVESADHLPANTRTGPGTTRRATPRYAVVATGAFVSLLLHAFLITSLAWSGGHARMSSPTPAERSAIGSEPTMELEMIEDVTASITPDEAENSVPRLLPVSVKAALTAFNIPFVLDPADTQTDFGQAESARSALVGLYMGQIDARIERAWRRPRTPINEGLFSCRVRIEQDSRGEVKEITLERCNGDATWQVSLVHAIQAASPLPAPSDPKVFKRVIRMGFRSELYSAQALQDAYEPAHQ
jgi:hypothetical protein